MPPMIRHTCWTAAWATLLVVGLTPGCEDPLAQDTLAGPAPFTLSTVVGGGQADPTITIQAPANNSAVIYDEGGTSIEVTIAVSQTEVGEAGHFVRYYLDGSAVACVGDADPFTFGAVPYGRHHLAARLVTPSCEGLPNPESLDAVYVKVLGGCAAPEDCEDGLSCSAHACTTGTCNYGPQAGCCDHDLECPYGWVCDGGTCVECLGDVHCDDGNNCTTDSCLGDQTCDHVLIVGCCVADGQACEDGEICTTGDTCDQGACLGGPPPNCDDANPCTDDTCEALAGCSQALNTAPCDDGNDCTVDDICDQGACVGTPGFCDGAAAEITIDSPSQNDTFDTDDGLETIQMLVSVNQIVIGQSTFHIAYLRDGGLVGQRADLQPYDFVDVPAGRHQLAARIVTPDGQPIESADSLDTVYVRVQKPCGSPGECEDGLACSNHACTGGTCKYGGVSDCCDQDLECPYLFVCFEGSCITCFEDGDCTDFDPCTADVCTPEGTCDASPIPGCCIEDGTCDDGNACTDDVCNVSNECEFVDTSDDCIGDNPCKAYSCVPALGCQQSNLDVPCDDEDVCTLGDGCSGGACLAGSEAPDCDDLNPCTWDACDPVLGCQWTDNQAACDDQDACTVGDTCGDGACVSGVVLTCDDKSTCTSESCDPAQGCVYVILEGSCDDGTACTQVDLCVDGVCVGTDPFLCDDANPCTDDSCKAQSGCEFSNSAKPCDDQNPCTSGDKCSQGACNPGQPTDCDDDSPCTADVCDPAQGCVHTELSGPCSDGDQCTTEDLCVTGVCVGGPAPDCDDQNLCTDDSCNPGAGCVHVPNLAPCDDQNICTTGDACSNGGCAGQPLVDCDDGDPCTVDSCDDDFGCTHTVADLPCDDGDACTVGDQCAGGLCEGGGPACDDGDPCTVDGCVAGEPCTHDPYEGLCDDGDPCTVDETCAEGICAGGGDLDCDDGDLCTADICQPGVGCTHPLVGGSCDDQNACTIGDACELGVCVPGSFATCDDALPCTLDGCDATIGCVHLPDHGLCDDGDGCTQDLCVVGVGCIAENVPAPCDDEDPCTILDVCDAGICTGSLPFPCNGGLGCADSEACDCGTCVCTPDCSVVSCGTDGCGGSCGDCGQTEICFDGACVDKIAATSCESLGVCCAGDDPTCEVPGAACACDEACVDYGDCCPDACDFCGFCGAALPCLDVEPQWLDFGEVVRGTSASLEVTLTHCGEFAPISLVGFVQGGSLASSESGAFYLDPTPDLPEALEPGTSVVLEISFAPSLAGEYDGSLHVKTDPAAPPGNPIVIPVTGVGLTPPAEEIGLSVQVTWDDESDLDAHLLAPGGSLFHCEDDCFYYNRNPDWGVKGSWTDDPFLDVDDTDGFGPEIINLSAPAPGIYTLAVHVYYGTTLPVHATVELRIFGQPAGSFEQDLIATSLGWNVFAIDWPAADVTAMGAVYDAPPPGAPMCGDSDPCTVWSWADGWVYWPSDTPCDDKNPCTVDDVCAPGGCAGAALNCDDGDPCTDDKCAFFIGCYHLVNQGPCNDGDACQFGHCAIGTCVIDGVVPCGDDDPCTEDSCDSELGCVYQLNPCDDGDPCTDDSCDPANGCVHGPVADCDPGAEPGPESGPEPGPEPGPEQEPDVGPESTAELVEPGPDGDSGPVDGAGDAAEDEAAPDAGSETLSPTDEGEGASSQDGVAEVDIGTGAAGRSGAGGCGCDVDGPGGLPWSNFAVGILCLAILVRRSRPIRIRSDAPPGTSLTAAAGVASPRNSFTIPLEMRLGTDAQ